jgi:hypothetical protein
MPPGRRSVQGAQHAAVRTVPDPRSHGDRAPAGLLDQAGRPLVGLLGKVGDDHAGACANVSAAAWPMPLAASVTYATLPAKLPS